MEKKIKQADVDLAVNYDETAANPEFFDKYQSNKKELEKLMKDWELVQEKLENLENQ